MDGADRLDAGIQPQPLQRAAPGGAGHFQADADAIPAQSGARRAVVPPRLPNQTARRRIPLDPDGPILFAPSGKSGGLGGRKPPGGPRSAPAFRGGERRGVIGLRAGSPSRRRPASLIRPRKRLIPESSSRLLVI
jgi:hypothetical protein